MRNKSADTNMVDIDLMRMFRFYLRRWWVFLLSGILLGSIIYGLTAKFVTPVYRSSVTVYVNNTKSSQSIDAITGSSLTAAQQLVHTYIKIIESNTVLNSVIQEGELSCSAQDIRDMMDVAQVDDTEMFTISISHPNPEMAYHVANTMAEVAPQRISEFVEGSSTKIIDYAELAKNPYAPNCKKNAVLGGLIGCVLAAVFLTLRYLFDMRLKTEEDLEQFFDLPILGTIPDFMSSTKKSRYGYSTYGD